MRYQKYKRGSVRIEAKEIRIGKKVRFGKNIDVKCNGVFELGDFSRLGDNCKIRGNDIRIGKHFYNSSGLNVGGGGSQGERANLTIGDRCTIHNNFLNVCEPIVLGDDVGLSQEVSIITHGYWLSVLDGFPREFEKVVICSNVIVGYRSTILPGVTIEYGTVIGAGSVVTKNIKAGGIYAGNPARFIRKVEKPSEETRKREFNIAGYILGVDYDYPVYEIDDFWCDANTLRYGGKETPRTDKFRDELRKYGIRIYTERPF